MSDITPAQQEARTFVETLQTDAPNAQALLEQQKDKPEILDAIKEELSKLDAKQHELVTANLQNLETQISATEQNEATARLKAQVEEMQKSMEGSHIIPKEQPHAQVVDASTNMKEGTTKESKGVVDRTLEYSEKITETILPKNMTKNMDARSKQVFGVAVTVGVTAIAAWLATSFIKGKSAAEKTSGSWIKKAMTGLLVGGGVIIGGSYLADWYLNRKLDTQKREMAELYGKNEEKLRAEFEELAKKLQNPDTTAEESQDAMKRMDELTEEAKKNGNSDADTLSAQSVELLGDQATSILSKGLLLSHGEEMKRSGIEEKGQMLVASLLKKERILELKIGDLLSGPHQARFLADIELTEGEEKSLKFLTLVCQKHVSDIQKILDKRSEQKDVKDLTLRDFINFLRPSARTFAKMQPIIGEISLYDWLNTGEIFEKAITETFAFSESGQEEIINAWEWFSDVEGLHDMEDAQKKFGLFIAAKKDVVLDGIENVETDLPAHEKGIFIKALQKIEAFLMRDETLDYLVQYIPAEKEEARNALKKYIQSEIQTGDAFQLCGYILMSENPDHLQGASPENSSGLGAFMLQLKVLDILRKGNSKEAAHAQWRAIFKSARYMEVPLPEKTKEMLVLIAKNAGTVLKNRALELLENGKIIAEEFNAEHPEALYAGIGIAGVGTVDYLRNNAIYSRFLKLRNTSDFHTAQHSFGYATPDSFKEAKNLAEHFYRVRGRGWQPLSWLKRFPVYSHIRATSFDRWDRFIKLSGYANADPDRIVEAFRHRGIAKKQAEVLKAISRKAMPEDLIGYARGGRRVGTVENWGTWLREHSQVNHKKVSKAWQAMDAVMDGKQPDIAILKNLGFTQEQINEISQVMPNSTTIGRVIKEGSKLDDATDAQRLHTHIEKFVNDDQFVKALAKAGASPDDVRALLELAQEAGEKIDADLLIKIQGSKKAQKLLVGATKSGDVAEMSRILRAANRARNIRIGFNAFGAALDVFGIVMAYCDWQENKERIADTKNPALKELYANANYIYAGEAGTSAVGLTVGGVAAFTAWKGGASVLTALGASGGLVMLPIGVAALTTREMHKRLEASAEYHLQNRADLMEKTDGAILQHIGKTSSTESLNSMQDVFLPAFTKNEANESSRSDGYDAYFRKTAALSVPMATSADDLENRFIIEFKEMAKDDEKAFGELIAEQIKVENKERVSFFANHAMDFISYKTNKSFEGVDAETLERARLYAQMEFGKKYVNETETTRQQNDWLKVEQDVIGYQSDVRKNLIDHIVTSKETEDLTAETPILLLEAMRSNFAVCEQRILEANYPNWTSGASWSKWYGEADFQIAARGWYAREIVKTINTMKQKQSALTEQDVAAALQSMEKIMQENAPASVVSNFSNEIDALYAYGEKIGTNLSVENIAHQIMQSTESAPESHGKETA